MNCNHSRPGFELVLPCPFPTTITITPRTPPSALTFYSHQEFRWLKNNVQYECRLTISSYSMDPTSTVVHDDASASIQERGKEGFQLTFYSNQEFRWLKNNVQYECRLTILSYRMDPTSTVVHDDASASIQERGKEGVQLTFYSNQEFRWLKNNVKHECRPTKIIIQFQIRLEIILFFKLNAFKLIGLIEMSLWCAIFCRLGLHAYTQKLYILSLFKNLFFFQPPSSSFLVLFLAPCD